MTKRERILLAVLRHVRDQTIAVQHSQETRLNDIYDICTAAIDEAIREYDISFAQFMERIMPDYREGARKLKEKDAKGIRPPPMSDDDYDIWVERLEGCDYQERGR